MADSILQKIYSPETFRTQGHHLIERLADYLHDSLQGEGQQVYPGIKPERMLEIWREFDTQGLNAEGLVNQTLEHSILLHNPKYMGHQVVPPAPFTALMELLSALLNNGMAVYEMGPASTAMERLSIEILCRWMDMPAGSGGFLTSGGSAGNLTALLSARKHQSPKDMDGRMGILVSEQAHYSVERAGFIMGLGVDSVLKVPVDSKYSLDPSRLQEVYQRAIGNGIEPLIIVGSACTTSSGSYDPLNSMADFAEKHGLWFHVDGAHGAIAHLLPEYKHLVEGLTRADSIVIDFHKMFMVPALVTAVLYRDEKQSFGTFNHEAEYLLQSHEQGEWYNSGNRTLECTKLMMGLKAYSMISQYGKEAFVEYGNTTFGLARTLAEMIRSDKSFELAMNPQSNIVCFRYSEMTDAQHTKIRDCLLETGDFYIVQTRLGGRTWFRTTIMNPFTKATDFEELLTRLKAIAEEIRA